MVRFSPDDGSRLLAASREASTAYLWQVTTRKKDRLQHGELVSAALFNPQGDRIVTTGGDLTQPPQFASAIARVWDVESSKPPKPLFILKGHEDKPNPDKIVRAAVDLTDLRNLKAQWGINTAEFSPDGKLIVTAGDDGTARVWNAKTGELYRVLGEGEVERHEGSVLWVAFSHDGSKIVTTSRDHTAKVWDIGEGKPVAELNGHFAGVSYSEFGPKDRVVLTLSSRDETARIWDAGTGRSLAILPGDDAGPVVAAAISPKTGQYLIRAHRDGKVLLHKLDISGDLKDLRNSAENRMNAYGKRITVRDIAFDQHRKIKGDITLYWEDKGGHNALLT